MLKFRSHFGTCLFLAACAVSTWTVVNAEAATPVEEFKDFIANPPPVEMTYEKKEQNLHFVHVLWQKDAFLYQVFSSEADYLLFKEGRKDYLGDSAGYADNFYWSIGRTVFVSWLDTNSPPLCPELTAFDKGLWWHNKIRPPSPAASSMSPRDITFARILLGGLWEMPIGSLKWNGDDLSFVTRRGHGITAHLFATNNYPQRLEVVRKMETSTDYFTIFYTEFPTTTAHDEAPFFPRLIVSYCHSTPTEPFKDPDFTIKIPSIRISPKPFENGEFQPAKYWHKELEWEIRDNSAGDAIFKQPFVDPSTGNRGTPVAF